jgi:hypothetical protein
MQGGPGDDVFAGEDGNDLLHLDGGSDKIVFDGVDLGGHMSSRNAAFIIPGHDLVTGFTPGEDQIQDMSFNRITYDRLDPVEEVDIVGFARLDSNKDGRLTGADAFVDVRSVTAEDGIARNSLIIDAGSASTIHFDAVLTLHGVTSLTENDFAARP